MDVANRDGSRGLVVPNIKSCEALTFSGFLAAFNAVIGKARTGKLTPADFKDTTCTLTNPGMIGTVSSLPRLMMGQSFIMAIGSIGVPAEFMGAAETTLSELGVSKVMNLTNTYDHRVIQARHNVNQVDNGAVETSKAFRRSECLFSQFGAIKRHQYVGKRQTLLSLRSWTLEQAKDDTDIDTDGITEMPHFDPKRPRR